MELVSQKVALEAHQQALEQAELSPKFGYPALDAWVPGLLPGSLTVLAAQTSMGKTTLAANFTYLMACQGRRVLFCSLESGVAPAAVVGKLAAGHTEFDEGLVSYLAPTEAIGLLELEEFLEANLHHAEVIFIDHLHYLVSTDSRNYSAAVGGAIRRLAQLAKRLGVPVVVIAHTRKLPDKAVPCLADLRDSSFLAQDPDLVLILHRFKKSALEVAVGKEPLFGNTGLLMVAKNRLFGATGTLDLKFNPDKLAFSVGG